MLTEDRRIWSEAATSRPIPSPWPLFNFIELEDCQVVDSKADPPRRPLGLRSNNENVVDAKVTDRAAVDAPFDLIMSVTKRDPPKLQPLVKVATRKRNEADTAIVDFAAWGVLLLTPVHESQSTTAEEDAPMACDGLVSTREKLSMSTVTLVPEVLATLVWTTLLGRCDGPPKLKTLVKEKIML